MGIFAFLFRMVLRLMLWAFALVGALIMTGALVWLDVRRVYPDTSGPIQILNRQAESSRQRLAYGTSCEDVIADLNRYAALGSGSAYIAAAALDESGECGRIDGGNAEIGMFLQHENVAQHNSVSERLMRYRNRFLYSTGFFGDHSFWQQRDELYVCRNLLGSPPVHAVFENAAYRALSYHQIRERQSDFYQNCTQQLFELGREHIDDSNRNIRQQAASAIQSAAWQGHADAQWWMLRIIPMMNAEHIGFIEIEELGMAIDPECAAIGDHYNDIEVVRDLAARGQADAIGEWMQRGPMTAADEFAVCMFGVSGIASQYWRGGYDTPFWYAVHAIRTEHKVGAARLPEMEAQIGDECLDLARTIGEGLRDYLAAPSADVSELRQQILASVQCQPEELRSESSYNDGMDHGPEGYWPPELQNLPDFEPIFRRVATANEIEN